MSNNINNITIAILGPVSAGKSTFFNALFTQTCSDMKRKKTTMLPQIYQTTFNKNVIDDISKIYEKNKKSNEEILLKREDNTFNITRDFNEIIHNVDFIEDFITLPDKNATYSILDMPGLNCGGDELYYNYINLNSHKIDIYVLVFDVNSGLNTSDEIKILDLVLNQIRKNDNGYLHILMNKCDELEFTEDGNVNFSDEELNELYNRSLDIIKSRCDDIKHKVTVSPICASKLYVFRGVKNNISMIDEKQLDMILKETVGNIELKKMKNDINKKRKFIEGLLKEKSKGKKNELFDGWMDETGYSIFSNNLKNILSKYHEFIYYHISLKIDEIEKQYTKSSNSNINFEEFINEMKFIDQQLENIKKNSKVSIPELIYNKISLINNQVKNICEIKISSFAFFTDIPTIENLISKFSEYVSSVEKYLNGDNISSSYKFIENKKNTLLIAEFTKKFNCKIFEEIKDVISKENFVTSITNSLENVNIFEFKNIYYELKKYDIQPELYQELIKCFENTIMKNKLITKYPIDEKFNFCKNCVTIFNEINNKFISNVDIIITTFKYFMDSNFSLVLHNWITLNANKINNSSDELKYFYFCLNLPIPNIGTFTYNFEMFTYLNTELNQLYDMLNKISHNDSNKQPIKPACKVTNNLKFNDDSNNSSDSEDSDDSVVSDDSVDSSKCVYQKAKKNASNYTKKILGKNVIEPKIKNK